MKLVKFNLWASLALVLTLASCTRNEEPIIPAKGAYENGIFISNEGNFGKPNASITYVSNDLATVENDVYGKNNGNAQLGDVLQSIGYYGDNAYLVVNNSNKIEVVNRWTMKKSATLTENVKSPRYLAFSNDKMFVTNNSWNSGKFVAVYSTSDHKYLTKIDFTDSVEKIFECGGKIVVQNAAWGTGKKISYINPSSTVLEGQTTVPNGDIQNIACYANFVYALANTSTDSYIYKISTSTKDIVATYTYTGKKLKNLRIDENKIYCTIGNSIYAMDVNTPTLGSTALVTVADNSWSTLYGFEVINGKIFTADAKGFSADSEVKVHSATNGSVLKTFTAGMGSNGFYKN